MSDNITFEDRVKFHYFGLGSGRVTIAYKLDSDRDNPIRTVQFGFAFCSPKDFFSKKDYNVPVYGEVFEPKYNKNVKKIVSYTTEKGGRSRALERLGLNPVELSAYVPDGDNAVLCCIEAMENYCYEQAPSWRDKVTYRHTRSGNHEISRDGVKVVLTQEGIELHSPWEGVTML